ncbi:MAG: polysaccharide pyruvyl transferase family protein [Lachnospira sp.]
MAEILIYLNDIEKGKEYDIWDKVQNSDFYDNHIERYGSLRIINYANKLWFQSLISCISTPENHIDYYNSTMEYDYINSNYDMVICPQANLFNAFLVDTINNFTNVFKNIKIPVYMIACGAQADSYDKLDELVEKIGDVTKELIETVYSTGGEFALRGNFTKEFFDRLGKNTAVVTGCPSIYQMGRDLYISDKKVGKEEFKPLFNGNLVKETYDYPESMYIDQETFFYYLYNTSLIQNTKSVDLYRLIKMHGYEKVYLLFSHRIRLFVSMNEWFNYIKINGFNFSCGSRIHGNIMPILAGVPSMIYPCDSRVREMQSSIQFRCMIIQKRKAFMNSIWTLILQNLIKVLVKNLICLKNFCNPII